MGGAARSGFAVLAVIGCSGDDDDAAGKAGWGIASGRNPRDDMALTALGRKARLVATEAGWIARDPDNWFSRMGTCRIDVRGRLVFTLNSKARPSGARNPDGNVRVKAPA